jgi:hypothetical protein
MTPIAHRRFAAAEAAFAAAFLATLLRPAEAVTIALLAAATLLHIFYLSSFLRGATEDA